MTGIDRALTVFLVAYFCYLCGKHLRKGNPYDHFNDKGTTCYMQLFAGIEHEE